MSVSISQWTSKQYYTALFLMYTAAHGGVLLIPNAIYWDDWTLYQVNESIIFGIFKQAGSFYNLTGYLHNYLLSTGPWLYRIITFFIMFFAGISLNSILNKHQLIGKEARFLIVLLFLIYPFYWARVALIDLPYTLSYFLFFLAWAIMDKYRTAALLLFFLSFNTNSLLVFYTLPFLDHYTRTNKAPFSIKSLIIFSTKKIDFLILPFFYFGLKVTFFPPSGVYEGYNEHYSALNLLISPVRMSKEWFELQIPLLGTILIGLFFYYLVRHTDSTQTDAVRTDEDSARKALLYIGTLAIFLASFPYWILGHIPTFNEWSSRHQILLPLGFSLVSVGVIVGLERNIKVIVVSLLISVSLTLNTATYKDFFQDWLKQKELIELFRASSELRAADIVVFDDKTLALNAIGRTFRPYEWNGLMFQAFNDERRMGLSPVDYERLQLGKCPKAYISHGRFYRMGDLQLTNASTVVRVTIESEPTRLFDRLRRFGLPVLRVSSSNPIITPIPMVTCPGIFGPR